MIPKFETFRTKIYSRSNKHLSNTSQTKNLPAFEKTTLKSNEIVKIDINMPRIPKSLIPEVLSRSLNFFLSAEYQRRRLPVCFYC